MWQLHVNTSRHLHNTNQKGKRLTWTRAPSCSPHSSRQTPWTFSSCTRASSHTSQRWCSERLPAFPTSGLKTERKFRENDKKQRIRDMRGEELTYYTDVPALARGSIQSLTHNLSTVPTGQHSVNEPEQPIPNSYSLQLNFMQFLCVQHLKRKLWYFFFAWFFLFVSFFWGGRTTNLKSKWSILICIIYTRRFTVKRL